jgi:hypothetical protein
VVHIVRLSSDFSLTGLKAFQDLRLAKPFAMLSACVEPDHLGCVAVIAGLKLANQSSSAGGTLLRIISPINWQDDILSVIAGRALEPVVRHGLGDRFSCKRRTVHLQCGLDPPKRDVAT